MSHPVSGLRAWIIQRLSAVYMLLFLAYAAVSLAMQQPDSWNQWVHWVMQPLRSIALLLFFLSLLIHTWVGIRDVILDYVSSPDTRLLALGLVALALLGQALWITRILIGGLV